MSFEGRIVVRAPNWIGDHVMAFPFYEGLRKLYPKAHIALLNRGNLSGLGCPEWFDEYLLFEAENGSSFSRLFGTRRKLMRGRFDVAISLPSSASSAILFALSGIRNRVGFAEPAAELFYTAFLRWRGRESNKHKGELYQELLELVSGHPNAGSRARQETAAVSKKGREGLIVVAPGASTPLREWPYFVELLQMLRQRFWAFRVFVAGAESEGRWHAVLRRLADPKIEDGIGKTSLDELVEICRRARLVIANDSGVAHVASKLGGAPTLVVFGPGDPDYVRPEGSVEVAQVDGLPCCPCESARCLETYGYQECLRSLAPEIVFEKAVAMLSI